ncbi:hypothetical protein D9615_010528 [Tricholomella constricta]|uniref:DNA breaking-rejoining enzyme n=1 Tax=Tricholomella constricta TaxID=117010 RepID=A0A8H5GNB9_9AGAR|nr:hypothetical protein D9615_010528 [Tricholomella constricta]
MDSHHSSTAPWVAVDVGFGLYAMRKCPPRTPSLVNTPNPSTTQSLLPLPPDVSPLETMSLPPRTTSSLIAPGLYVAPLSARQQAARALPSHPTKIPSGANSYHPSPLRPVVPADQCLLMWTTPHSSSAQASLDSQLPVENQSQILLRFLDSLSPSTRQSYGAGLLRFTQFCDRLHISETLRMPASDALLSAFVADAAGSCSGESVRNWLHGLRAWHVLNRAEWHGRDLLVRSLQRSANKLGSPFKRPLRNPISGEHLLCLHHHLDVHSPCGAATWAAALAAFWGCRRLGELLPPSAAFDPSKHISRFSNFKSSIVNNTKVLTFHLPSTKTSPTTGDQCILTATNNIFCPVTALQNHLRINHISTPTHLFAFITDSSSYQTLTKSQFLHITTEIFVSHHLDPVYGHSYRIGGTVELLASGVPPEIIMKLSGWSSLCFLLYWRRLDYLVPIAITRAWTARRNEFAQKFNLPTS